MYAGVTASCDNSGWLGLYRPSSVSGGTTVTHLLPMHVSCCKHLTRTLDTWQRSLPWDIGMGLFWHRVSKTCHMPWRSWANAALLEQCHASMMARVLRVFRAKWTPAQRSVGRMYYWKGVPYCIWPILDIARGFHTACAGVGVVVVAIPVYCLTLPCFCGEAVHMSMQSGKLSCNHVCICSVAFVMEMLDNVGTCSDWLMHAWLQVVYVPMMRLAYVLVFSNLRVFSLYWLSFVLCMVPSMRSVLACYKLLHACLLAWALGHLFITNKMLPTFLNHACSFSTAARHCARMLMSVWWVVQSCIAAVLRIRPVFLVLYLSRLFYVMHVLFVCLHIAIYFALICAFVKVSCCVRFLAVITTSACQRSPPLAFNEDLIKVDAIMRLRGGVSDEEVYQQFVNPKFVGDVLTNAVAKDWVLCLCDKCEGTKGEAKYRLDFRARRTVAVCKNRNGKTNPGNPAMSAFTWLLYWKQDLQQPPGGCM
jgi:hypothetical protein